jgi:hypothetical protein
MTEVNDGAAPALPTVDAPASPAVELHGSVGDGVVPGDGVVMQGELAPDAYHDDSDGLNVRRPLALEPGHAPTPAQVAAQLHARAVRHWMPPDLWNNGAPPLKETWDFARYGEHVPEDEAARAGSQIATAITIPLRALWLYLDWLSRRLSRLIAAAVLVFVLIMVVF